MAIVSIDIPPLFGSEHCSLRRCAAWPWVSSAGGGKGCPKDVAGLELSPLPPPSSPSSLYSTASTANDLDRADAASRQRCSRSPTRSRTFALSAGPNPPAFNSPSSSAAASPPPSSSRSSAVSNPSAASASLALRAVAASIVTERSASSTGTVLHVLAAVRATSAARLVQLWLFAVSG